MILGGFPGRLAFSMSSLAVFFHIENSSGSVAAAGTAVGAFSFTAAVTAGARGALVDKLGQTKPLLFFVPSFCIAMWTMGLIGDRPAIAVPLAAITGLTAPPFNMSIRPLWQVVAGNERVRTAYALDSVLMNIAMLLGPVVSTFVALTFSTTAALAMVGTSMLIGGSIIGFSPVSRSWIPEAKQPGEVGLFRSPSIRLLAVEGVFLGFAMGLITISIPAAATLANQKDIAGTLMAMNAFGSIVGGLAAGVWLKNVIPINGLVVTQFCAFLFAIPLALTEPGWGMAAVLFCIGLSSGPAHVMYMELVDRVRPRGTASGALAALWTIEGSATAAGAAIAGTIAEVYSPQLALKIAAALILASPIVMLIGRRTVFRAAYAEDLARAAA